ncbi:MAG: aminotransferase class V-fold PLP-dependent enzyme, partial [Patescibacteria group bacterium]|nr:aminotransferase class V-fold PLP-dependent enzyme [Patescibacteria group bacterium]
MRIRRRNARTYLDSAAGVSGNPSSPHAEGRAAREELERSRVAIARLVEAKPDDVLFTSGATEANALAILGTMRAARSAGGAGLRPHALYWPGSHASIVENMKLAAREGAVVEPLPVAACRVDCDALAKLVCPETVLISLEAVDGETGVVWNTREVARIVDATRRQRRFIAPSGSGSAF